MKYLPSKSSLILNVGAFPGSVIYKYGKARFKYAHFIVSSLQFLITLTNSIV